MPSIKKMLQSYDLDLIERIASFWGVDCTSLDHSAAVRALSQAVQDQLLLEELLASLPDTARQAWNELAAAPTKTTWAVFTRQHGEVREFGPAKRDREAPEKNPVSVAETLWYRGLIGRAFMDLPPEPREFVFIPDEIAAATSPANQNHWIHSLKTIPAGALRVEHLADSRLVDHLTDWLAALRMGRTLPAETWKHWPEGQSFLARLASEIGLTDLQNAPIPEVLQAFFQTPRESVLRDCFSSWNSSIIHNDLQNLPGLVFEGSWQNDPLKTRHWLLDLLQNLQPDTWYSLKHLLDLIKKYAPDFQRPSGDYDSWFIRQADSELFLRGFEHWDEVDGRLIRYLVAGPLHWLGMLDLGISQNEKRVDVFRRSVRFEAMLANQPLVSAATLEKPIRLVNDLVIEIPLFASPMARYQIARFCEVQKVTSEATLYEITPASLLGAQEAGLKPLQLLQLLERTIKTPISSTLKQVIANFDAHGLEARLETRPLLSVRTPEMLQALQQNPRTAKWILNVLNPTTAVINPAGLKAIENFLKDTGILLENDLEV